MSSIIPVPPNEGLLNFVRTKLIGKNGILEARVNEQQSMPSPRGRLRNALIKNNRLEVEVAKAPSPRELADLREQFGPSLPCIGMVRTTNAEGDSDDFALVSPNGGEAKCLVPIRYLTEPSQEYIKQCAASAWMVRSGVTSALKPDKQTV